MSNSPLMYVDVIGDSGPFSRLGKSIGYRVTAGDAQFLVDCGAPVFQLLGEDGLGELAGIVGTHAHEDHKRWFTDIALFEKFTSDESQRIELFGSDEVLRDYRQASTAALERTLSPDSREIVNYSYEDYINTHRIAPEPKYRLNNMNSVETGPSWRVVDRSGDPLPPDRARVFMEEGVRRPRILFKDPREEIWVEPESFYAFTDERFYDVASHEPYTHENGLKITPIKASAWHGPSTNSLLFEFQGESLFFSSDTMYDPSLWQSLTESKQPDHAPEEHGDQYVINADINNFIEQTWSEQRLDQAFKQYDRGAPMIHDVTGPWATVHTDYENLEERDEPLLLTHSPDVFTTVHPLAHLNKRYAVEDNRFIEITDDGDRFVPEADCYHKAYSQYYVGFEEEDGDHYLLRKGPGQFDVVLKSEHDTNNGRAEIITSIALYEEIGGEYFPFLLNENEEYIQRPDGQVERVIHEEGQSRGTVVEGRRALLNADKQSSQPSGSTA